MKFKVSWTEIKRDRYSIRIEAENEEKAMEEAEHYVTPGFQSTDWQAMPIGVSRKAVKAVRIPDLRKCQCKMDSTFDFHGKTICRSCGREKK